MTKQMNREKARHLLFTKMIQLVNVSKMNIEYQWKRKKSCFLRRFNGLGPSHMSQTSRPVLINGSLLYVQTSHDQGECVRDFSSTNN